MRLFGEVTGTPAGGGSAPARGVVAPPLFHSQRCAAGRRGVAGCRACADVCPHGALSHTEGGPRIDADACARCGACSAACPLGALERAFAPDAEMLGTVERIGGRHRGCILVLGCAHGASESLEYAEGVVRLSLPCVQLVSDDLLLWAVASGVAGIVVDGTARCPNVPHVGPRRAVEAAAATLRWRGDDGDRILYEDRSLARALERLVDRREALCVAGAPVPAATRVARRAALLRCLGAGDGSAGPRREEAPPPAVPWREARLDAAACTACGSCAQLCPTGALGLDPGAAALRFTAQACVGCHLCAHGCPERALALEPVVPGAEASPRLLGGSAVAACRRCGEPLAPEALLVRLETMLGVAEGAGEALRFCERCKVERLLEAAAMEPVPAELLAVPAPPGVEAAGGDARPDPRDRSVRGFLAAPTGRRELLRAGAGAALGAAALATLGGCAAPAEESDVRWGMVIDTASCVGCRACAVACKAENHTPPGVAYTVVLEEEVGEYPHVTRRFLPRPCMQCASSSCTLVCPTGATYHRPDGIVAVDYDRCIGCRYCIAACPYGARSFDYGERYAEDLTPHERQPSPEYGEYRARQTGGSPIGNVRKCTFCLHRIANDLSPACAETCMAHAIHFGNLKDPAARCTVHGEGLHELLRTRHAMRLKEELGNEPAVYYLTT